MLIKKLFIKVALCTGLLCALTLYTTSQADASGSDKVLSLHQAIERTLQKNPRLHQFQLKREALSLEKQLKAQKPAYSVGIEFENFAGSGDQHGFKNAETTIALSSILELGDKRTSRLALANTQMQLYEQQLQAKTLDILGDLTETFIQALAIQEELHLIREEISVNEMLSKSIQYQVNKGIASDIELMQSRAVVSQTKIKSNNLDSKFQRYKYSLAKYWGDTQPDFQNLQGNLFAFKENRSFEDLYAKVKQSPSVSVLASEKRLKEAELNLARTQDSFDISWQLGIRRFESSDDTALVTGISVPLYATKRNKPVIETAKLNQKALQPAYTETLLNLHQQLFTAYSQRKQYLYAQNILRQDIIPNLEKALLLSHDAWQRGRLRHRQLLLAQQELLNAKVQMLQSAAGALLNQAAIEQLTAQPFTLESDEYQLSKTLIR